jgi:hypothetical protein
MQLAHYYRISGIAPILARAHLWSVASICIIVFWTSCQTLGGDFLTLVFSVGSTHSREGEGAPQANGSGLP